MDICEIKKIGAPSVDIGTLSGSLAQEAESVLGYKAKATRERAIADSEPLAALLTKLEISILDPIDVHRYQTEKRHEADRIWLEKEIAGRDLSQMSRISPYEFPRREEVKLSDYTQPIPEFVLNKAIQIKREMPDVSFYVESLNENPDPFLVVKFGQYDRETYRIEVWAEPTFKGR